MHVSEPQVYSAVYTPIGFLQKTSTARLNSVAVYSLPIMQFIGCRFKYITQAHKSVPRLYDCALAPAQFVKFIAVVIISITNAGDGKVEGQHPIFASESPTRATEAQGALFGAHSAHLDLNYL